MANGIRRPSSAIALLRGDVAGFRGEGTLPKFHCAGLQGGWVEGQKGAVTLGLSALWDNPHSPLFPPLPSSPLFTTNCTIRPLRQTRLTAQSFGWLDYIHAGVSDK